MQTYRVKLVSPINNSFFCQKAVDSVDLNISEKLVHDLNITADIKSEFNVGLILGASGSGKTTLAYEIFGKDCFINNLNNETSIIDQFPENMSYEERVSILCGVGLTQVPCWVRPVKTLSNGQKARAEAAILMCQNELTILDEWTSVVDRVVGKVMSHCIQKHARNKNKQIILISCHYDVIEWLNPDWIIDCNKQIYENRRLLWRGFKRQEHIKFDIRKIDNKSWKYFSKYHYLSSSKPPGFSISFGLFIDNNQIGFLSFSNYVPKRKTHKKMKLHSNRLVIHPDYCGFGLGIKFVNESAKLLISEYEIYAKFSSLSMYHSRIKDKNWRLINVTNNFGNQPGTLMRKKRGFRKNVKTYTFKYLEPKI